MRSLCRENMEDWEGITDDDIDREARDSQILENVARLSSGLVLMRKRAFDAALEVFPSIKDQGANWRTVLTTALGEYNENELKDRIQRAALMRKALYSAFPELKNEKSSEKRDFEKIFHDYETFLSNDVDRKRMKQIFHNYKEFHQIPDSEDMSFILGVYSGVSDSRKKELLAALGVTLTIKDALEW